MNQQYLFEEKKSWLKKASRLHTEIKRCKVDVRKYFPNQEFLHLFSNLDKEKWVYMIKFLNYDKNKLVEMEELEAMVRQADFLQIDKGNVVYSELKDIHSRANNLKNIVNQYTSCKHKSYADAKLLFFEILQMGIWLEEAEVVLKIINVNKKIDDLLVDAKVDGIKRIKELTETQQDYIDIGFKKDISLKHQEIEILQRKISIFLEKPYLEFNDMEQLEELVSIGRSYS